MSPPRFSRLLGQLRVATFVEDRRLLLTTAAQRNHFRCRQLGRILAVLEFSDEKLEAVRLLRPRLVDLDNATRCSPESSSGQIARPPRAC